MGDANAPNFRYLNHFFEINQSQSAAQDLQILKRNQGIPWVNTIAADDKGDALYADISVTPHVTNDQALTCGTAVGLATFRALRPAGPGRLAVLVRVGQRPGLHPEGDLRPVAHAVDDPQGLRHQLQRLLLAVQPAAPLTGFARIIGEEGSERTTRTRSGLVMVAEQLQERREISRQELQDLLFGDRQHSFELVKPDLLQLCGMFPGGFAPSPRTARCSIGNACAILAKWNGRDALDARGALLFRRFWTRATAVQTSVKAPLQQTPIWKTPFSAADPVNTPRGLNIANPLVWKAFGDAIVDLNGAHIPLDAPLGQVPGRSATGRDRDAVPRWSWRSWGVQRGRRAVERDQGLRRAAGARLVVHPGGAVQRHRVPGCADDPDLLAVDERQEQALLRPDQAVLQERLADRPLLREGRRRASRCRPSGCAADGGCRRHRRCPWHRRGDWLGSWRAVATRCCSATWTRRWSPWRTSSAGSAPFSM